MSCAQMVGLTLLAMLAFASNSLLCRLALKQTAVDPASSTAIRVGLFRGERVGLRESLGLICALAGFVGLPPCCRR